MIRWGLVYVAIAIVFVPAVASSQFETPTPVAIGIVRADGVLFPLARFENNVWTPLMTDGPDETTAHLTETGHRLARAAWTAFPLSGGAAFPLTLRGVTTVDSHCVRTEAIRTNAPTRPFPPQTWPMPKVAIAVSGSGKFARVEQLTAPYDAEARRVTRVIVSLTQTLEAERVDAETNSPLARYTANERGQVPVQITKLGRTPPAGQTQYYFEARKRYRSGPEFFVKGWFTVGQYALHMTEVQAAATHSDNKGIDTAQVLGVLALSDRAVWVLEAQSYESEAYELMEFVRSEPARRASRVEGGGC